MKARLIKAYTCFHFDDYEDETDLFFRSGRKKVP